MRWTSLCLDNGQEQEELHTSGIWSVIKTGLTMNRGSQSPAKIIRPYFIKQDAAGVPEKSILDGGEKGGHN